MRLLLIMHFVCCIVCSGQEVRFYKEDLTFQLHDGYFTVDGYYWFANESNDAVQKVIYFPVGSTDKEGSFDNTEVYNVTKGITQNIIRKDLSGFYFLLTLAGADTEIVRIKYRQKVLNDSAVYVLRSTLYWRKPLESAEYKLWVSERTNVYKISIPPDTVYALQGSNIYYWKRKDFMPEKDFIFHFKEL